MFEKSLHRDAAGRFGCSGGQRVIQPGKAMSKPCPLARIATRLEFPARRRPPFVDPAGRLHTNLPSQCSAARGCVIGAAHA